MKVFIKNINLRGVVFCSPYILFKKQLSVEAGCFFFSQCECEYDVCLGPDNIISSK